VAACVYSARLLENLGKGEKNQQSVVMHMENHMLCETAYAQCLPRKGRYAEITTCQLHSLLPLENPKSLCSEAEKYTAVPRP
jgi:hypothetical protein